MYFVEQLLLSEEEVKIKTEMWMKENEDYLKLQKGNNLSFCISSCSDAGQHNSYYSTMQDSALQQSVCQFCAHIYVKRLCNSI